MSEKKFVEVRISGVPKDIADDLKRISEFLGGGKNFSALIKPKLREIRDSYPVYMRKGNRA